MIGSKSHWCTGKASTDAERGPGTTWEKLGPPPAQTSEPYSTSIRITKTISYTED